MEQSEDIKKVEMEFSLANGWNRRRFGATAS